MVVVLVPLASSRKVSQWSTTCLQASPCAPSIPASKSVDGQTTTLVNTERVCARPPRV